MEKKQGDRLKCSFDEAGLLGSYHGSISREDADKLLVDQPEGTFLFRKSSKGKNCFVASVKEKKRGSPSEFIVSHYLFRLKAFSQVEGYVFDHYPARVCPTLYELMKRYTCYKTPLPPATSIKRGFYEDTEADKEAKDDPSIDSNIDNLPFSLEIFLSIFQMCDIPTLGTIASACKLFYVLSKDEQLWQMKYLDRFGGWVPPSYHEKGEIDWKIKYWFEHSLITRDEPMVYGLVNKELLTQYFSWYYLRYSTTVNDSIVLTWRIEPSIMYIDPSDDFGDPSPWNGDSSTKMELIYRVKAPRVGYSLKKRPSSKEVFSSLTALLEDFASRHHHFTNYVQGRRRPWTCVQLRRVLLHDPALKILDFKKVDKHSFELGSAPVTAELFRLAMANNRFLEELRVSNGVAGVLKVFETLCKIPSNAIGPLHVLRMLHGKNDPLYLDLKSWLDRADCPLDTLCIEYSNVAIDGGMFQVLTENRTIKLLRLKLPAVRPSRWTSHYTPVDLSTIRDGLVQSAAHIERIVISKILPEQFDTAVQLFNIMPNVTLKKFKGEASEGEKEKEGEEKEKGGEEEMSREMRDRRPDDYVCGLDSRQYEFGEVLEEWRKRN